VREILRVIEAEGTLGSVIQALETRYERQDLLEVIQALAGRVLQALPGDDETSTSPALDSLTAATEARILPGLYARPPRRRSRETRVRTVAILGSGTAGLLAALTLRRKLPDLDVTVIASRRIPVIGVGEATTPLLPALLHGTLGIDMADFFQQVRPTWKLGIRFLWGKPAPYSFNYPFAAGRLGDSLTYEENLNSYCLASLLMEQDRSNLLPLGPKEMSFLPGPFAYHLDNERFVTFLENEAKQAGVRFLDRRVVAADLAPKPEGNAEPNVEALVTEEGEHLPFDFFLDCSGFRSFLLGETLETPFLSYASSLPTDSALTFNHPHGGHLKPYTTATTLERGWCWSVPQEESDHRGYVFSSAHGAPEEAEEELRRLYPSMGTPRLLRFRCGRHADFWRGNVAALGNAYGFVEPLESTALHMVAATLATLVRHFPGRTEPESRDETRHRALVNASVGEQWDRLRDFLALHYKLNRRLETPFWKECRETVDLAGAAATLDLFRERGPLSGRPHPATYESLWGDFGRDVLLLGQGAEGPRPRPELSPERWRDLLRRGKALAERALPQTEAHQVLLQEPELLRRLQRQAPWLQDSAVGGSPGW